MSRKFVTGDCHGNPIPRFRRIVSIALEEGSLTREDVLIVTGDFGVIWATKDAHKEWFEVEDIILKELAKLPVTVLIVDGNHENHARLDELVVTEKFGGKVGIISENVFLMKRGEVFTIGGETFFAMGGAMSTDRHHRVADVSWWAREIASTEEMQNAIDNLEKHNFSVDYVIAHTFPASVVSEIIDGRNEWQLKGRNLDPMAQFFERLVSTFDLKFRVWFGGHFHDNASFRDGKYVLLYGNSIELGDASDY